MNHANFGGFLEQGAYIPYFLVLLFTQVECFPYSDDACFAISRNSVVK